MRTTNRIIASVTVVGLAAFGGLFSPAPLPAQLANASATTIGLAGNHTATARGFAAISVNPAGLAMPGSGFSLSLLPIQVRSGIDPINFSDLKDVEGTVISAATKEEWLSRVNTEGRQSGTFGVDVSELALTVGRLGLQLSTIVSATMNLAPDIVEAVLFGNAGRTGSPTDLSFSGSTLEGFAVTTAGLSLGVPINSATGGMAIGATVKWSVGHGVAVARDQGGSFVSDPTRVTVNFPIVHTDEDDPEFNNGSGVGLDVGFMMTRDRMSFGVSVQNVFNTFAWKEETLRYRPGTADIQQGSSETDFEKQSYSAAPAALKATIEEMTFDPTVAVGGAYDVSEDFTVSADVRSRLGDGLALVPRFHLGAGAEYRGLRVLHLRGGAAIITDGFQLGGGASLVLGPVNFSAAVAVQTGDLEDTTFAQFVLSFGNR
ncbi:MAG: conjugal transfer protein TraF [Gemmatimonadetes bacterium]|nr:conjugal transfer protein TraF [Gemmatimonadota bacterium]